jgi:drug/metabolite transporter (DMT)-like permease
MREVPRSAQYRWAGLAAVMISTVLWSLGAVVISDLFRRGVRPLDLIQVRIYVTAIGLGMVAIWRRSRGREARRDRAAAPPRGWWLILGLALAIAMATTALVLAIKHLPVAVAIVLQNLAPAFVVGSVLLAERRRPGIQVMAGLALALAGVALVVRLPALPLGRIDVLGVLYGVLAAVGVAGLSVAGERATKAYGAIRANALAFTVVGIAWLVIQLPQGVPQLLRHPGNLGLAIAVGIFGTLAPFVLFAWGTARLGSQAGAINISLEPIFSAIIAWIWLGQSLDTMQIVGMLAVIGGIVYTQRHTVQRHTVQRQTVQRQTVQRPTVQRADRPDAASPPDLSPAAATLAREQAAQDGPQSPGRDVGRQG